MSAAPGAARWRLAARALTLWAAAPAALGGVWLRARPGPARDRALALLPEALRRIHPGTDDEALFGGLDLAATLAQGRMVARPGLLSQPGPLLLSGAERAGPGLAARLAAGLDGDGGLSLVALDEGACEDEALTGALADRLAFWIDLDGIAAAETVWPDAPQTPAWPLDEADLAAVEVPEAAASDLAATAARCGIAGLRAPILALTAARVCAALARRGAVGPEDLHIAAALVLGPRATLAEDAEEAGDAPPEAPEPDAAADAPPDDTPEDAPEDAQDGAKPPREMLVEAVRAALPPQALAQMQAGGARTPRATGGSGARRAGKRRGRPLPARPGRPGGGERLDLVATLRAAAPWQTIRRRDARQDRPVHIRPADLRVRRFQETTDRLVIFAVDASGSAALSRLAEAKGAVELMLAQAYASRDQVALIGFRGTGAELLLPPTRSLVQTKRRLSALPGGGATPLAAGLAEALALARRARAKGLSPALCLITDGVANVALDGAGGRDRAAADAAAMAGALRAEGVGGLVIDISRRPRDGLAELARTLGAPYLALPRADAGGLSGAVAAALGD